MKRCAWCRRELPARHPGEYCDWVCEHVDSHNVPEGVCGACDALTAEMEAHGRPFAPQAHLAFEPIARVIEVDCETCSGWDVLGSRIDPEHGDVVGPWRKCPDCRGGKVEKIVPVTPAGRPAEAAVAA